MTVNAASRSINRLTEVAKPTTSNPSCKAASRSQGSMRLTGVSMIIRGSRDR